METIHNLHMQWYCHKICNRSYSFQNSSLTRWLGTSTRFLMVNF